MKNGTIRVSPHWQHAVHHRGYTFTREPIPFRVDPAATEEPVLAAGVLVLSPATFAYIHQAHGAALLVEGEGAAVESEVEQLRQKLAAADLRVGQLQADLDKLRGLHDMAVAKANHLVREHDEERGRLLAEIEKLRAEAPKVKPR